MTGKLHDAIMQNPKVRSCVEVEASFAKNYNLKVSTYLNARKPKTRLLTIGPLLPVRAGECRTDRTAVLLRARGFEGSKSKNEMKSTSEERQQ
jgi:hypothetical protein